MDNLTDLYAQHQAHLHRYGTFTTNRILKLLQRSDARLTGQLRELLEGLTRAERIALLRGDFKTRRLVKIRESIRELAAETRRIISDEMKAQGAALAAYELTHTEKIVALTTSNDIKVGVTGRQAHAAAMSRPMLGRHVRDDIADFSPKFRKDIFAAIREGYFIGETTDQIIKRIKGTAPQQYKDGLIFKRNGKIERTVRTSLTHIATVAREEAFKSLGVERVMWRSVLDGRTSRICASRDGQVYKVGKGPRPPAHPNCRSIMMDADNISGRRPFVKDDKPVSKIPKDERKGKIGQVNSKTKFSDFLERNEKFARDWLGPTKFRLWKEKKYDLSRFVDPLGKEYTLAELKMRDAKSFKEIRL